MRYRAGSPAGGRAAQREAGRHLQVRGRHGRHDPGRRALVDQVQEAGGGRTQREKTVFVSSSFFSRGVVSFVCLFLVRIVLKQGLQKTNGQLLLYQGLGRGPIAFPAGVVIEGEVTIKNASGEVKSVPAGVHKDTTLEL